MRRRRRQGAGVLAACLGTGAWCGGAAGAPAGPPARVAHVVLEGDFEAMAPVRRVGEELERSARDGDALVVLEMDGDRGRPDVALALAELVRASRVPVAAYLADARDRRVGAAQACVASVAASAAVHPATVLRAVPGDGLVELAPERADRERAERGLAGAVYARLRERGASGELGQLLSDSACAGPPPGAWALVPSDAAAEARVVFEDPGPPAEGSAVWRLVDREPSGAPRLELAGERLVRLRVAGATAQSALAAAGAAGVKGAPRARVVIDLTLARPRTEVAGLVGEVDDLLRRAGDDLGLPKPPRSDISEDRYRAASSSARERLVAARERLARCERLVAEYPELLRTPAPGQTELSGTPAAYAARWRTVFQKRADSARALEDKASSFDPAGRK